MTSGVEANLENSGDSVRSPASADEFDMKEQQGYKYKEYDNCENNNDVKVSKGMMLGGSPAELYYKQLLAANVAVLGKAAKMGFNANLYPVREDKRANTPEDETGSVSSNDESNQIDNDPPTQVYQFFPKFLATVANSWQEKMWKTRNNEKKVRTLIFRGQVFEKNRG